ncbi:MAG TPA: mycofactocin-coupled SDR family oxidoreductase [Acidimicrobiales bacterium]
MGQFAAGRQFAGRQFDGQVVLITGGARGQGRSHAFSFAREGADVAILDLCRDLATIDYRLSSPSDMDETARLVEKEGGRCLAITADVSSLSETEAAVARTVDELGRLDVLIANAGVTGGAPIQVAGAEQWKDVIAVNLTGVFNSLRAAAPVMIRNRYGRIIAISSMMGRGTTGGMGAYTASKWGVIGLVKSAAQDLAQFGITVNAVAPGTVDTPMVRNEALIRKVRPDLDSPTMEDAEKFLGMLHVQPQALLDPAEISAAVMFLAGPGAAHITGAVLDVSAGASARVTA